MPEEAQNDLKAYTENTISLPILRLRIDQAWNTAHDVAKQLPTLSNTP